MEPQQPVVSQEASEASARRSGVFTALLVIAIVLGSLGTLVSLVKAPMAALQTKEAALARVEKTSALVRRMQNGGHDDRALQLQREMATAMVEKQLALRPAQIAEGFSNLALSAALLIGALLTLKRRAKGRKLLRLAALAHLPYQVLHAVLGIVASKISLEVTEQFTKPLMASVGGDATANEVAATAMRIGQFTGIAAVVGTGLVLSGYYVWLAVFLGRKEAQSHCRL